jgi:dipeptide/tripeptide permease
MKAKICIASGLLVIVTGFVAAVYFADQIMDQVLKAQIDGTPEPNLDINAAVLSSLFVSIGFVLVIIGLIKLKNKKKTIQLLNTNSSNQSKSR